MKKVILITNSLYEYRYPVYNEFVVLFQQHEYEFKIVVINDPKRKIIDTTSPDYIKIKKGYNALKNILNKENPDVIISFLAPSNKMLWFLFLYSKLSKTPNITWTHGINLQDPKNKIKKILYNIIHGISTALILYSNNELIYIKKNYHSKTFFANNTINFNSIPGIYATKEEIKEKHGIAFCKTVLFVGRMQQRKRIEVLIEIFKEARFQKFGLLIVGPGFDNYYKKLIESQTNIKYLGAVFEAVKVNEIFKCADLFCIPGTNGLGINQAMYWGLPCLTLNVRHSPEIVYLVHGETGYILNSNKELSDKIYDLLNDDLLRNKLSINAKNKIMTEATIDEMFKGFIGACQFVLKP